MQGPHGAVILWLANVYDSPPTPRHQSPHDPAGRRPYRKRRSGRRRRIAGERRLPSRGCGRPRPVGVDSGPGGRQGPERQGRADRPGGRRLGRPCRSVAGPGDGAATAFRPFPAAAAFRRRAALRRRHPCQRGGGALGPHRGRRLHRPPVLRRGTGFGSGRRAGVGQLHPGRRLRDRRRQPAASRGSDRRRR